MHTNNNNSSSTATATATQYALTHWNTDTHEAREQRKPNASDYSSASNMVDVYKWIFGFFFSSPEFSRHQIIYLICNDYSFKSNCNWSTQMYCWLWYQRRKKHKTNFFFFTSASLSFQRLLRNEIKRLHHKIALVRVWKISTTYKMADIRA